MIKVVVAFGAAYPDSVLQMALRLNRIDRIHLTAAFIPQVDYEGLWNFAGDAASIPFVGLDDPELLQENIRKFEESCQQNQLKCTIKTGYFGFSLPELIKETRFADLLFISQEGFNLQNQDEWNEYLRQILQQAECPALVIPSDFNIPRSNILCYDGSASSVFAISQFSYLFPNLSSHPTLVVYGGNEDDSIPDREEAEELIRIHYPNYQMIKVSGESEDLKKWIGERKRSIIVSGGFGRGFISNLFRKSFVHELIKLEQLPIFVAHK